MAHLPIPTQGVATNSTATDKPPQFSPYGGQLNVLVFTPPTGRPQVGQRPGLAKAVATRLGTDQDRAIRALCPISRASAVTSFTAGQASTLAGVSKRSLPIAANIVIAKVGVTGTVDGVLVSGSGGAVVMRYASASASVTVTGNIGAPTSMTPTWAVCHPSGTLACVAFRFASGGSSRAALVFLDPRTGEPRGVKSIAPSDSLDVPIVGAFTSTALVLGRASAFYRIALVKLGDSYIPADLSQTPVTAATVGGNAPSGIGYISGICSRPADGLLWACFSGSTASGNIINPTLSMTSGVFGRDFRSGIIRLRETSGALAYERAGALPTTADPFCEVDGGGLAIDHQTLRLSAVLGRNGRGATITAIAAAPDGFIVSFTNDGWGPTTAYTPDGNRASTNVAKFSDNGVLRWLNDLQGRIGAEVGGKRTGSATTYPCDVPDEDGGNAGTTSKAGPGVRCLAVDSSGVVFAGTRVTSGRFNCFCMDADGGTVRWRTATESNNPTAGTPAAWIDPGASPGGTVTFGVAVDPADSQPVFIGHRNQTYGTGNTYSASAQVFKLAAADGSISWAWAPNFDTAAGVGYTEATCLCVGAGSSVVVGVPPLADT